MLERIGETAYRLDLAASKPQALCRLHDVFHVNLLRRYRTNGLDYEAPPLEIDGEKHYKVQAIQKDRVVCGEMQYLVKWTGYDESENLWLTASQLDSAKQILEAYQRENQMDISRYITRCCVLTVTCCMCTSAVCRLQSCQACLLVTPQHLLHG